MDIVSCIQVSLLPGLLPPSPNATASVAVQLTGHGQSLTMPLGVAAGFVAYQRMHVASNFPDKQPDDEPLRINVMFKHIQVCEQAHGHPTSDEPDADWTGPAPALIITHHHPSPGLHSASASVMQADPHLGLSQHPPMQGRWRPK